MRAARAHALCCLQRLPATPHPCPPSAAAPCCDLQSILMRQTMKTRGPSRGSAARRAPVQTWLTKTSHPLSEKSTRITATPAACSMLLAHMLCSGSCMPFTWHMKMRCHAMPCTLQPCASPVPLPPPPHSYRLHLLPSPCPSSPSPLLSTPPFFSSSVNWKGSKKKKAKKKEGVDLYALLGLQNERWTANEAQLKNGAEAVGRREA